MTEQIPVPGEAPDDQPATGTDVVPEPTETAGPGPATSPAATAAAADGAPPTRAATPRWVVATLLAGAFVLVAVGAFAMGRSSRLPGDEAPAGLGHPWGEMMPGVERAPGMGAVPDAGWPHRGGMDGPWLGKGGDRGGRGGERGLGPRRWLEGTERPRRMRDGSGLPWWMLQGGPPPAGWWPNGQAPEAPLPTTGPVPTITPGVSTSPAP